MAERTLTQSGVEIFEERGDERIYAASQWQLMWWRLRKHRLAMISALVLSVFYIVVVVADFLPPPTLESPTPNAA